MKLKNKSVLIIGGGGREHALGWKISQSNLVESVYYAPGNAGTINNVPIRPNDFEKLVAFAQSKNCLTIIGPEAPISLGIVDYFSARDSGIFGPSSKAAKIETSKSFAKGLLQSHGIPTPRFVTFTDHQEAIDYVLRQSEALVIKADGIAAGKGVVVCNNQEEAINAIEAMMVKRVFGEAGDQIVIEEKIRGQEVSLIVLSDGSSIKAFPTCRDYKNIADGNVGPNTGGMGSYSPVPYVSQETQRQILDDIIERTVSVMKSNSAPFAGFLYAGLMIDDKGRASVLEFNARMGDPECQSLMVRMNSDLFEYLLFAEAGKLNELPPLLWKDQTSICVVMAAKGYPSKYQKGEIIHGLKNVYHEDTTIFHSGTIHDASGRTLTNGGRVLSITSLASNLKEARQRVYEVANQIT
ncbi:MAG: phosphoribosylamine--glycine ligase, partial [Nitrososphaeraceae archaeon]